MAQILLSPTGRDSPRRGVGKLVSPPIEPVEEHQKPRLGHYRALMSRDEPDLKFIEESFREWSQYPEWLVFHGEHIHTGEHKFKAVKSAKRGNGVYSWKIKKRLAELSKALPDVRFFNYRDRSSRHKTKALFVTLTFARVQRLDLAWENIGKAWNQYMSRLRRKFKSKVHGFRVWEAQRDGYPHIHAILIFESSEFETFHYGDVWRVQGKKEELEPLWKYGFSDYEALTGVREGFRYVTKYLTKLHRVLQSPETSPAPSRELNNLQFNASVRTLSLMWIFKRRAFGFSGRLVDLIREMTNSNKTELEPHGQVDLEGQPVWIWRLMGFWGGFLGHKWSRELSLREVRELKHSSSWTSR